LSLFNPATLPVNINTSLLDQASLERSVLSTVQHAQSILVKQVSVAHEKNSRALAQIEQRNIKRKLQEAFPALSIVVSLDNGLSKVSQYDHKLTEIGASFAIVKYKNICFFITKRYGRCSKAGTEDVEIDYSIYCFCDDHADKLNKDDDEVLRQKRLMERALLLYEKSQAPQPEPNVTVEEVHEEVKAVPKPQAPNSVPKPQAPNSVPQILYDPEAELDEFEKDVATKPTDDSMDVVQ